MSQEVIAVFEKSLVENTRVKRAQWIAFLTLLLASIGCLLWIGHLTGRPGSDIRELLMWSVIAILVFVCYGITALAIYINGTSAKDHEEYFRTNVVTAAARPLSSLIP